MNQNKLIGIALAVLAIGGGLLFAESRPRTTPNTQPTAAATSTASTAYTLADVAKHKDQSSCWTAINGGVYDLTSWIAKHPGGEGTILSICGIDGSAAFNGQHGGQGRPERVLESYKIGLLK